jgi:hypothetical protein
LRISSSCKSGSMGALYHFWEVYIPGQSAHPGDHSTRKGLKTDLYLGGWNNWLVYSLRTYLPKTRRR